RARFSGLPAYFTYSSKVRPFANRSGVTTLLAMALLLSKTHAVRPPRRSRAPSARGPAGLPQYTRPASGPSTPGPPAVAERAALRWAATTPGRSTPEEVPHGTSIRSRRAPHQ